MSKFDPRLLTKKILGFWVVGFLIFAHFMHLELPLINGKVLVKVAVVQWQ
jgi:hypothetical protein